MTTNKARDRFEVVCLGDGGTMFSQARSHYIGEAGTLAWMLAGRAYAAGHERPEIHLSIDDQPYLCSRPDPETCKHIFNRGAQFWGPAI